jgi:hypothetical protein
VSRFAAVDQDPGPSSLIRFLDHAAASESGLKHYVAAAHALRPVAGGRSSTSAVAPATTRRCWPASGSGRSAST